MTLCRPLPGPGVAVSPFVGTWFNSSVLGDTCVHIAQAGPATFVGWSDWLQFPGRANYAYGVSKPLEFTEIFGSLDGVKLVGGRVINVGFGNYVGICAGLCKYSFVGRLSADGSKLRGNFGGYAGETFRKMPGESCELPMSVGK